MTENYFVISVNYNNVFLLFLFTFIFLIIHSNSINLVDDVYGHGLSRDESIPFDVSGKEIAIEGILEPPFLNEGNNNQNPTFVVRTHDEKNNETIKDINYRIIAKFKNKTVLDQRFHSLDGIVSPNLIPSNDSLTHKIIPNHQEQQEQQQKHLSKNDQVKVSFDKPVTIKSKILADGGLYYISVILKSSKGVKLDSDKKVDLFISIGKDLPFVIKDFSNNSNVILTVKTFYDEILDFVYDQST